MRALLDLFVLLNESILLTFKDGIGISVAWIAGAIINGVVAFLTCGWLCRCWNRYYRSTPLHLLAFGSAAILACYGTLLWPGSAKLGDAMNKRIDEWTKHLTSGMVPVDDELRQLASETQADEALGSATEIAWRSFMGLNSRKYFQDKGITQIPNIVGVTVAGEGLDAYREAGRYCFGLAMDEFDSKSPYLHSRLASAYDRMMDEFVDENIRGMKGTAISFDWTVQALDGVCSRHLKEQVEPLSFWTRIVSVAGCIFAVVVPALVSGFVSYGQIRDKGLRSPSRRPSKRTAGAFRNR